MLLGLVDPHAAEFLAPTVETLLDDAELLDHLGDGLALALKNLGYLQFADDGFGGVSFLRRDPVLQSVENTNLKPRPGFSG